MADNTTLNAGTGGDVIATDDLTTLDGGAVSGVKVQRVKVGFGVDGTLQDVEAANPLPVTGTVDVRGTALAAVSAGIAASATGTIGPLDVSRAGNVTFILKNTVAASAWAGAPVIVFEQSDDNTSWSPLMAVRNDTGQAASTFTLGANSGNAELMFDAAAEAMNYVRARVTTGPSTNGMTVVIQAGSLAYSPVVSQMPAGSTTPTVTGVAASASSGTLLAANNARRGATIQNDAGSANLYVRLGSTAATAASGGHTVLLVPGAYYEVPFGYSGAITGIWSAATGFANVTEVV